MSNFLKDLGVLLFSAGEEIEQKADDFKKKREGFGPPSKIRMSSRQAKKIFEQNCFRLLMKKYLRYDYFLLFEKSV